MAFNISVHRVEKISGDFWTAHGSSGALVSCVEMRLSQGDDEEPTTLNLFFARPAIAKRYADAINAVTAELAAEFQQAAE